MFIVNTISIYTSLFTNLHGCNIGKIAHASTHNLLQQTEIQQHPVEILLQVRVNVSLKGGGSGTGIKALIDGTTDIANCSRKMKPTEKAKAEANSGKKVKEFVVGKDALAIYVHQDNPLEVISLEELAEIYGEHGTITKWSQLIDQQAAGDAG